MVVVSRPFFKNAKTPPKMFDFFGEGGLEDEQDYLVDVDIYIWSPYEICMRYPLHKIENCGVRSAPGK